MAPPTAPAALASNTTCTCLLEPATAARQDERRRQWVAAIHKLLRRASARYPRSAGQRTVRWARRTSRPDDGAGGLVWCTKGNRPLSPYPRASLITPVTSQTLPCSCRTLASLSLADPSRPRFARPSLRDPSSKLVFSFYRRSDKVWRMTHPSTSAP